MRKAKVVIGPFAQFDIADARNYYKQVNKELSKQFLLRIKEARSFVGENPRAVDVVYRNVRMHLIKQFPYHLHYIFDETKNLVVIIAVEFAGKGDLDFFHRS